MPALSPARLLIAVLLALAARPAWAVQQGDACVQAYEGAQEKRLAGMLRAAREDLSGCTQATCPAFMRTDCARWLEEIEAAQPTVVFVVRLGARDLEEVTVTCNDQQLADHLDGRAIAIDPGRQVCRFEAAGVQPATTELMMVEGHKRRVVEIALQAVPPPPRPAPPPPRPVKRASLVAPLVLSGVALAGVGGFVGFGVSGLNAEHRLRDECSPGCSPDDLAPVRRRYALADVSLGLGLLAAAAAGYLYWSGRQEEGTRVGVVPGPDGGILVVGAPF